MCLDASAKLPVAPAATKDRVQNTFNLFVTMIAEHAGIGAKIAEYAGNDNAIPNMRNGRCFPTALAL